MKLFELNGNNFDNLESFYDEVQQVLCPGFPFGRNLDALNDAFVGGLSTEGIEYYKPAMIVWKNSEKSKQEFGEELFIQILKMIQGHEHQLKLV